MVIGWIVANVSLGTGLLFALLILACEIISALRRQRMFGNVHTLSTELVTLSPRGDENPNKVAVIPGKTPSRRS